ncbi:CPBP family intramembrane glutamic endopeptidase [Flavobacterium sp. XGLA_31]|uniref:CPBP family intramembrane glutamic endopeptidase n=1 Tax=Flavobacterium sp. XGLA_31 TaxID=3447666 RepID=UPI003F2FC65C
MFIKQLLKTNTQSLWLYLPIPLAFVILMGLNYLIITGLHLDVNEIMKNEIKSKGVNGVFIENMIPFAIGLLLLFIWVKYLHKQSIRSLTTSRAKVDWGRIFFSFAIWTLFTVGSTVAVYYTNPEDFQWNFKPMPFLILTVLATLLIPIQTSFEEYLFRGYMMQGIGLATKRKVFPLLITSFMFGIMHIANPEVEKMGNIILIYYIGTGLFLGIITLMDEGMELALGFHAANNLVGALLITSDWSAFQTDSVFKDTSIPSAGFDVLMPVFIIFPILLFIFSKKYKWNNWKDRLIGEIEIKNEEQLQNTTYYE